MDCVVDSQFHDVRQRGGGRSQGELKFEMKDGKPALMKEPKVAFIDDGPGKAIGISNAIGKRPFFAAGNSDGDLQMLQYTTLGTAADGKSVPRFAMFVHHTDAEREFAYDRDTKFGRLDKGLTEAS